MYRSPLVDRKAVVERAAVSIQLYHSSSCRHADRHPLNTCYRSADKLDIEAVVDGEALELAV